MSDISTTAGLPGGSPSREKTIAVLKKTGKIALRCLTYLMNIFLTLLLIGLICTVIIGTVFAIYIGNYVDPEIESSLFVGASSDTTTRLFYNQYDTEEARIDENGTAVELEEQRLYSSDNSIWVSYDRIPKDLINAFISIEDHRFESHNGVDWLRTGKAVVSYFFGKGDFGGSTLTQQLVKNLTGDNENSIQRKVQEIFRAINLEKQMSKEQILEMYLNIIFLGNNCYGVQAASNTYFDKDVSELSLVECASLAAIVKNPSQYEPVNHDIVYKTDENGEETEVGNRKRRNDVLFVMNQYGCINDTDFEEAVNTELVLKKPDEDSEKKAISVNSWYTDAVINDVQNALMEKYGYSSYVASLTIYTGGLQIYTCMDKEVQDTLEDFYKNDSVNFPAATDGLQPESSMIVIDPYTGDVLGLVGGRGEKTQNRIMNRATQSRRPAGSCIKPLSVYGPAIDTGTATMGSAYDDTPVQFVGPNGNTAWPRNLPDVYNGLTTVKDAIRRSVNTIAVRLLQDVGVDYSFSFLRDTLHMDSLIESYQTASGLIVSDKDLAPLALGQFSYGITLWEITAGYTIFQNEGIYNESRLWYKVLDSDGNEILRNRSDYEIAMSSEAASIMTIMMQEVVKTGTATAITLDQQVDVAGKTGTTTADFDRWFIGYTPYFVGGVWVGYDMNQALSDFGENPAVIIWDKVMKLLHEKYINDAAAGGEAIKTFTYSDQLVEGTYCKDSGKLMTDACRLDPRGNRAETAYFTRDTLPTEYCTIHTAIKYDTSGNGVACASCPAGSVKTVGLLDIKTRLFPVQMTVTDAMYTCNTDFNEKLGYPDTTLPYYNLGLGGSFSGRTGDGRQYNCHCPLHW